jgi:hypothetical protein
MSDREFSEEERTEYAEMSPPQALPDGSYPMPDCDAVERAIEAFPHAPESHREDLAALIIRRNEELACGHDFHPAEAGGGGEEHGGSEENHE